MTSDVRLADRRLMLTPHNCFACGSLNTHGMQLDLHVREDRCWTELTLPERFEGWEGIAHGGIVSTILDEVMAWSIVGRDTWAVTARMTIDFRRPIPIGTPIRAEGWVVRARRRLLDTAARIVDVATGAELATAEAAYVAVPDARKAELRARYGFRMVPDGAGAAELTDMVDDA